MRKYKNNFAFIDSQNLNLGIRDLGWRVDFARLRIYLREHYCVEHAFLFLGYLPEYKNLYVSLRHAGFHLVFKSVTRQADGKIKGNCDAELVLFVMILYRLFDCAVVITGDGDFACIIEYLRRDQKLEMVLVPNEFRYSALLKRAAANNLRGFNKLKDVVSKK